MPGLPGGSGLLTGFAEGAAGGAAGYPPPEGAFPPPPPPYPEQDVAMAASTMRARIRRITIDTPARTRRMTPAIAY
jgi:hypothetical protein